MGRARTAPSWSRFTRLGLGPQFSSLNGPSRAIFVPPADCRPADPVVQVSGQENDADSARVATRAGSGPGRRQPLGPPRRPRPAVTAPPRPGPRRNRGSRILNARWRLRTRRSCGASRVRVATASVLADSELPRLPVREASESRPRLGRLTATSPPGTAVWSRRAARGPGRGQRRSDAERAQETRAEAPGELTQHPGWNQESRTDADPDGARRAVSTNAGIDLTRIESTRTRIESLTLTPTGGSHTPGATALPCRPRFRPVGGRRRVCRGRHGRNQKAAAAAFGTNGIAT